MQKNKRTENNKDIIRMRRKKKVKTAVTGYLFVLPSFLGFAVFMLIPIIYGFYISLTNYNGLQKFDFVGLQNYITMFSDDYFKISLKNNVVYTAVTVPLTIIFALFLAVVINQGMKGAGLFKAMIFFPQVCSFVAVGIVWGIIFSENGLINSFLRSMGAQNVPIWLQSSKWALWAIMLVAIWKQTGYFMIMLLAGLQTIPKHLYEAAEMDGAGVFAKFFKVTLPMLSPTMFMVMILAIIGSFQVYDLIAIMTGGGPGTATNVLVFRIYQEGFKNSHFGYASAIAYFLFLIVMIITIIQFKLQNKWVTE